MEMKIKICGLTNLADARYAAAAGADLLGFIQVPGSPRYVDPGFAAEIVEWIHGPRTVGVFVDSGADEVNGTAAAAGFDLVQLHGDESPAFCNEIDAPVVKALRVGPDDTAASILRIMERYRDGVTAFLLDTAHPTLHGGTGQRFDWTIAVEVAKSFPFMLAGGLSPDNAAEAVRAVRPWGIDLSSGLESAPGQKDFGKIDALFSALGRSALQDEGS